MALVVESVAATSITTTGATMRGTIEQTSFAAGCCDSPCCTYTERFFYGTTTSFGSTVVAGTHCGNAALCAGGVSFSKAVTGLAQDTTYYFQARGSGSGCIGICTSSDSGSTLNFKTLADVMTITNVAAAMPGDTTCEVSCTFDANCVQSTANIKAQYKLDTEPAVWTDGPTISGITGSTPTTRTFSLTGLTPSSLYDFRFVATRTAASGTSLTSSEGAFTTAASSQTTTNAETCTVTDTVSVALDGVLATGPELLDIGVGEQVTLEIRSSVGEQLTGVWFYHFPTRSYWFWTLEGFSAALSSTDGRGSAKTWISIGSDIYLVDDESYEFDDRDQTHPIDDSGEFEAPLAIAPKAVDFGGRYATPMALDVKMGADHSLDMEGTVRIELTSDQYPATGHGHEHLDDIGSRRLLGTRTVRIAPDKAGVDEWRRYALGRLRPVNVVGFRLVFPRDNPPRRTHRVVINEMKLESGLTGLRRRRH